MSKRIVIIGAGQAAQSALEAARGAGFDGEIVVMGEEPHRPYQRPPLSKKYLLGDLAIERLFLRPEAFYAERDVALKTGARVAAIDRARREVETAEGETLGYDALLIATGARPRRLPEAIGGALPRVLTVRSLGDVDALAPLVREGARAIVVGGGYIGLEAAAVFAQKGLTTTLIEREPRLLARVAGPESAAYFEDLHRRNGVDVRVAASLARIEAAADGGVGAATLANGARIEADLVVVGVGVIPNDDLAATAGLDVDNGIRVDAFSRTSDPSIFAAGDVARITLDGRGVRLESVQNAIDLGAAAGRAMAAHVGGRDVAAELDAYAPIPWFWSDQFDVTLQIAGLGDQADARVVRPGARDGAQSVWSFKTQDEPAPRLVAVDAMNDARAYMVGKRLLEAGRGLTPEQAADATLDLKALL